MSFGLIQFTNQGRALQAKAQTGVQLEFTRLAVGDGQLSGQEISDLTALIHEIKSINLNKFETMPGGKAVVGGVLSNQDLEAGFWWRELGLFAQDPDVGEILYCYGNAGDLAEYIPSPGGSTILEKQIDIVTIVGNASNVTATIDESLIYVTLQEFNEYKQANDQQIEEINAKINTPEYSEPQEVTASVITLPNDVTKGQFSVTLKGRSLKNELNYNRDTWAEWSKYDGVVGDNTGLKFTADGVNWLTAVLNNINIKPSTKYGLLYNVIDSTLVQPFMLGHPEHAFNSTILPASKGNQKVILTSQSSILAQAFMLIVYNTEPAGNKIKLKDIRLFELPAGSEIEADFNTMSADQLAQKYPYIKGGSVVSTESVRIKSFGINMINPEELCNYIKKHDSSVILTTEDSKNVIEFRPYALYLKPFMQGYFKSNTQYTLSITIKLASSSTGGVFLSAKYTDGTSAKLVSISSQQYTTFKGTTSAGKTVDCITFEYGTSSDRARIVLDDIMLVEGTTLPDYEPYKNGGEAYIDNVGNSLLNGVFDEKSVISGEGTQRTGKYVLQASDITNAGDGTINQYVMIKKPADFIGYGNIDINYGAFQLGNINNSSDWNWDSATSTNTVGAGYNENYFYYTPPLGTYTDLAAAQAALAGKSLIYQLATEIPSKEQAQPLIAFPGGHLIIETGIIREEQIYSSSGITVKNTQRPIKEIESIWKIDGKTETPVDISKAVYTVGATTFTITGAQVGEKYKYVYKTTADSILPTVRFSYPLNISASISELNKIQQALSAELGDVWLTLLPLADKELGMYMITAISAPATATSEEIANKINEIINVWKG